MEKNYCYLAGRRGKRGGDKSSRGAEERDGEQDGGGEPAV